MSLAYRLIRLVHFIHTRQQFIMDLEMIMYNYTHFMKAFFTRKQHTVSWYKHKCTFIYVHRKSTMFSAPNFTCVRAYTHRCTHMHEHTHVCYLVSWLYREHSRSQLCSWRNKLNFWYPCSGALSSSVIHDYIFSDDALLQILIKPT